MPRSLMLATLLLATGCSAAMAPGSPTASAPAVALAGLTFTPLTPENARYAGGLTGMQPGATVPSPTTSAPAPGGGGGSAAPTAGAVSGNYQGAYYGYGPFFGSGEPMALVSLTQATTGGSRGPIGQAIATIVAPVLAGWAADARLTSSYGTTDGSGLLPTPAAGASPYPGGPGTWSLSYYAASRSELLTFVVTPDKTTVVRERWAPLDLAAYPAKVDNDAATLALLHAVRTRGFQSEEERTGLDYFLGLPFDSGYGYGYGGGVVVVPPVPAPDARPTTLASVPPDEVQYDVPVDAGWSESFQVILGKPVWQLSAYGNASQGATAGYYDSGAQGLVDATTGAVIRFMRPTRHHFGQDKPLPAASAEAAGTGAP